MPSLSKENMIIALKGYIGSGKSTLSKILKDKYQFEIINADEVVSSLYENINIQKEVCNILNLDKFSKKKISEIVFNDKDKLNELEKFIHPKLEIEINRLIQTYGENIVLDCQVIDKLNINHDYEILVTCPKEKIINRVIKRDKRDKLQIENILKEQERFIVQKKKIFPINMSGDIDIAEHLNKIINIFQKDIKNKDIDYDEDDEDDEYYW